MARYRFRRRGDYQFETYEQRDIVLRSMGFASYAEYLESDLWSGIRQRAFIQNGKACKICQRKAVTTIHHISYKEDVLRGDNLRMLVPLCFRCHSKVEFDRRGNKRSLHQSQVTYRQLIKKSEKARIKMLPLAERVEARKRLPGYCPVCGSRMSKKPKPCKTCSHR